MGNISIGAKLKRSLLNVRNTKSRSITTGLTIGLILTVVLVSTIAISLSYFKASQRAKAQLLDKVEEYKLALTQGLEIPLWNLDDKIIEHMGMIYAQNELVAKLRIIDSLGTVYFDMEKEGVVPIVTGVSEVWHNGESIGYIEISLTSAYYQEINQQLLWASIFTIGINLLSLIIMSGFLLRRFLRKPLKDLSEIVNSYASGKYDSSGHGMSFIEFQPFVAVLGEMGDRIKSQMTELQKAEEKYRSIFENAVEGIFQITLDGRFLGANPAMARILGYDSSEKLLESYNDIENQLYVDPERRKEFIRLIRESKMIYGFEAQFYRKNGSKIWVAINARSVYDENGELLFFEGFVEDTTERKLTQEALQKAHDELEAKVEERTGKLKEKTEKLERMNKLFVDRELRMKELKEEIKELKRKMQEGGG